MDWRKAQAASKVAAMSIFLQMSDELARRLCFANAGLYLIEETLIVKCQTQDDVYLLSAFVCDDLRSEIKEKEINQVRYIEIWHEPTGERYCTPVTLKL